ncbi:MAG: hypothetical protein H0X46_02540, partial [Bacteroidetes bacterium]|nr:hypothetical protein [Bacteroidota bacterium]
MKKITLIAVLFVINIFNLSAQENDEFEHKFDRAEKIFSEVYKDGKDESLSLSKLGYTSAIPIFVELTQKQPDNMNIAFKLGVCYLSSRKQRALSIPYFAKAVKNTSDNYNGS